MFLKGFVHIFLICIQMWHLELTTFNVTNIPGVLEQ